ncbi:hypothetical protein H8959_013503 [Pygathrix nigripes]
MLAHEWGSGCNRDGECAEDVWPARVGERAEPFAPLPCSAPRTNVLLQGTAGETEGRESPGVEGPGPTRTARLRGSRGSAARTPGSPKAGPPLPALAGLRVPPPGSGRGPRAGRFPWQLGKPALCARTRGREGPGACPAASAPRAPGSGRAAPLTSHPRLRSHSSRTPHSPPPQPAAPPRSRAASTAVGPGRRPDLRVPRRLLPAAQRAGRGREGAGPRREGQGEKRRAGAGPRCPRVRKTRGGGVSMRGAGPTC